MSKTDDIIKSEIASVCKVKNLKTRYFLGTSNRDQDLWCEGGLTFGYNKLLYGSNDFALYRDENWVHEYSGIEVNKKPVIVIEGTHCLNTKSYGSAQLQRFHHAYGSMLNDIISVYYLKKGKYSIRTDLLLAAYTATVKHRKNGGEGCYIVTDSIDDLRNLILTVDQYGENSPETNKVIEDIMKKMYLAVKEGLKKYTNYIEYLNKRAIFKSSQGIWTKYLGPKKDSITDSSKRYGHIVLGEAIVAKYLLQNINVESFNYFFPLMNRNEIDDINASFTRDKEWKLLNNLEGVNLVPLDEMLCISNQLKQEIAPFRKLNLNDHRKAWNVVRAKIETSLKQ